MCNYIITGDEIKKAEMNILDNGHNFNDEQIAFIKCLDPCYVQAYAGTGKTKALAGKIHILAQKKVWGDGRGICIISHTNVAVDEIKKHVAKYYPAVMEYPNFVGTIQEFINKFLFIPYLASNGLKIRFQDEYRFFNSNSCDEKLKKRIINYRSSINRVGNPNMQWQMRNFNEAINGCFINDGKVCFRDNQGEISEISSISKFATKACTKQNIEEAFLEQIKEKHLAGSFLYEESFIHGYEYLKNCSKLKDIISNRFKFVFLDEAQDCSKLQLGILYELFGRDSNTIFQQIGDENQSISEQCWKPSGNILHFSNSMRFGGGIEASINRLRVDEGAGIKENIHITTKKYLLKYNNTNAKGLLDKFSEILKTEGIPFDEDKGYFAISHEHNDLSDVFPYSKKLAQRKTKKMFYKFENDNEYLTLITREAIKKMGSNFISKILLNLFYKYYKVDGTWSGLRERLRNDEYSSSFKKLILEIANDVLTNGKITSVDSIKAFSMVLLGDDYLDLVANARGAENTAEIGSVFNNLYPPPPSEEKPKIRIGTIHSVKGQTHNATLLLSAKLRGKQDIEHALGSTAVLTPKFKRNLYVAFSRAQDLFAFAIDKTIYSGITDKSIFNDFTKIEI